MTSTKNLEEIAQKKFYGPFPLSFAQERLWFLDQLEGGKSTTYHMPMSYRFRGPLDVGALKNSFLTLIDRHESLRTRIIDDEGSPLQIIDVNTEWALQYHDLTTCTTDEKGMQLKDIKSSFLECPFHLAEESLIRTSLIKMDDEEYVLIVLLHHIVTDGWSMGILINELSLLYRAYLNNEENPLTPLAIQYVDYAQWQRSDLQTQKMSLQLEYWKNQLQEVPVLDLPFDRPRSAIQSHEGAYLSFSLDCETTKKIKEIGQLHGCTLFMTLLAAFNILLYRYTSQKDICIGTPIANRLQEETEPLIGFFANTLALRNTLSVTSSFVDMLKQVKEVTLEAYENQHVPFDKVVEIVQPKRSQAYSPLFQVMFVLQNLDRKDLCIDNLDIVGESGDSHSSKFDLTLMMAESSDNKLVGSFEYSTDLFNESTIERMSNHFVNLLKDIATDSDKSIAEIEILSESEKKQILYDWNDTLVPFPEDKCIHELFEEQVERTPDKIAVVFEEKKLTYRELNSKANQLAHYLLERGIQPDMLVAICIERSINMIVGILGILKAGGAYLPIDIKHPKSRINHMLLDSNIEVLITQSSLELIFIDYNKLVVCLDRDYLDIDAKSTKKTYSSVKFTNLVYVIYTSGSTGKPKGVMIEHQSLVNLSLAQNEKFKIKKSSAVLQLSSLSFDAAASEIFTSLTSGACLVMAHMDKCYGNKELEYLISSHKVTHLTLVPSASLLFSVEIFTNLHCLIFAGEKLKHSHLKKYSKLKCQIFNAYGPSEATVCSTIYQVNDRLLVNLPIGKPINNITAYILDESGKLSIPGTIGELHLGGCGLARGYINEPELTKIKFITTNFIDKRNTILYKTGDICRHNNDGDIEFVSRSDKQVKLSGVRIELEEIEKVLVEYDGVSDCVVVQKNYSNGHSYLVGYICLPKNKKIDRNKLFDFLSIKIPNYMIPSAFIEIDKIPVTLNGKIDSQSLPMDERKIVTSVKNCISERISEIWSEMLHIDCQKISLSDNFYELGGSSLLFTKMVNNINKEWGVSFELKDLIFIRNIDQLRKKIEDEITLPPRKINRVSLPSEFKLASYIHNNLETIEKICVADKISIADISIFDGNNIENISILDGKKNKNTLCHKYFHISCNSKILVSIIVSELESEGLIGWDEEIQNYAPETFSNNVFKEVTIGHLASHSHGLDLSKMDGRVNCYSSLKDYVRFESNNVTRRGWPKGSIFDYSSCSYSILLYICCLITNLNEKDLFRKYIFDTLNIVPLYLSDERNNFERGYYDNNSSEINDKSIHTLSARIENQICLTSYHFLRILIYYFFNCSTSPNYRKRSFETYSQADSVDFRYVAHTAAWLKLKSNIFLHYGLGFGHHSLVAVDILKKNAVVLFTNKVFSSSLFSWFEQYAFNNTIDPLISYIPLYPSKFYCSDSIVEICEVSKNEYLVKISSKYCNKVFANDLTILNKQNNIYFFSKVKNGIRGLCMIYKSLNGEKILKLGNNLYEEVR